MPDDRLDRLSALTSDLVGCEFVNILLCDSKLTDVSCDRRHRPLDA